MGSQSFEEFACPVHKILLQPDLFCAACDRAYPTVNHVPILLNEANSVFRIADYTSIDTAYAGASSYGGHLDRHRGIRRLYRSFMHRLAESEPVPRDFRVEQAVQYVIEHREGARILVIGAGDQTYAGNCMYTDVAFGKNVCCISDAHDLPFEDDSFDACIAVAVLEHVVDPQRCVSEIQRVLRPAGFVFAETPFMQPVHMGAHDFTRFTFLGHRRLFRYFEEIRSGVSAGPATSVAQLFRYFLICTTDSRVLSATFRMIGLLTTYPLRMLDWVTKGRIAAYDSASGFYFFGTLRSEPLSDRDLLKLFRGG